VTVATTACECLVWNHLCPWQVDLVTRGKRPPRHFPPPVCGVLSYFDSVVGYLTVWLDGPETNGFDPTAGYADRPLFPGFGVSLLVDIPHDERGFIHFVDNSGRDGPQDPFTERRFRLAEDEEVVLPCQVDDLVVG